MGGYLSDSSSLRCHQCQLQLPKAVFETSPELSASCPVLVSWLYYCHHLLLPHLPSSPLSAISCPFPIPHNHFLILNLFQSSDFIILRRARTNREEMSMRMKTQQCFLDEDLDASLKVQERPLVGGGILFIQPCLHCAEMSQWKNHRFFLPSKNTQRSKVP